MTWGIVALHLLIAIEVTSLWRRHLPASWWRRLHVVSIAVFPLGTIHALTTGTDEHESGHQVMLSGRLELPGGFNPNLPQATDWPAIAALLALAFNANRWKIFATVVVALVLIRLYPADEGRVETVRSFFGVHKIVVTPHGQYHVLMHGTTIHGAERFLNNDGTPATGRPEPITYYHRDGGIGQAITAIRERKGAPLRVAVIGVGSGTLACASEPGETWKFFEIDQTMVDTARDPKYFSYIQNCQPGLKPVIGDARLTFAKEPDGVYDLIIVDAYSSDAIPVHLATEEAMKIYKDKLAPQGAVVMHVSNRHLELASVIVGIADANDLKSWVYSEDSGRDDEYIFATSVVVSAREETDVGKLASSDQWAETEANENQRVWTDDYSNVLGAVWRRLRDGEQ